MAVFMINVCKFDGCGRTYPHLSDLVRHIEDRHIDSDPRVLAQKEASQPTCVSLSYVLRCYNRQRRERRATSSDVRRGVAPAAGPSSVGGELPTGEPDSSPRSSRSSFAEPESALRRSRSPLGVRGAPGSGGERDPRARRTTREGDARPPGVDAGPPAPTPPDRLSAGSELDEEELPSGRSEDSDESWTRAEEFSAEYILRYGSRVRAPTGDAGRGGGTSEKPFACPVPGCKKRYKNVNGIKYHSKNGHKKDGKVRKAYKCDCGKSYKTAQGLKTHSVTQHSSSAPTSPPSALRLPSFSALSPPPSGGVRGPAGSLRGQPGVEICNAGYAMDTEPAQSESAGTEWPPRACAPELPRRCVIDARPIPTDAPNGVSPFVRVENDASAVGRTEVSRSPVSRNGSSHFNIFPETTLLQHATSGILTPAASPISTEGEKRIKLMSVLQ